MQAMRIHRAENTAELRCGCGSGFNHYSRVRGVGRTWCAIRGCRAKATDGAHVWVEGKSGLYIVPTCHMHNLAPGWLELEFGVHPVPANAPGCTRSAFVGEARAARDGAEPYVKALSPMTAPRKARRPAKRPTWMHEVYGPIARLMRV